MKRFSIFVAAILVTAAAAQAQVNGVGDAREHFLPSADVIGVRPGDTLRGPVFGADQSPFATRPLYQGRTVRTPPAR